jgi:hypothetical protein
LSLLTGLRTEEVRALRWDHVVAWVGGQWEPVSEAGFDHEQLAVFVWRADRARGDTKTRAPFPVGDCSGGVGDLGVDVQLHVAVAGGVLQPVRHGQVGLVPLAGLPAVDAGAVGAGAGVAGLPLEVLESGVHGLPDHAVATAPSHSVAEIAIYPDVVWLAARSYGAHSATLQVLTVSGAFSMI